MRVHVLALGVALAAGAAVAACGGETDTTFGPPNGLVGRTPPAPSGGGSGSSSGASGGSSGSSSGSSGGSSGSSGSSSSGGGSGGDGGQMTQSCTVSWKTDIYPSFESTGSGTCASAACHGGTSAPTMVDNDPTTTWTNLSKYPINGVNVVGGTNPALECNLGITTPLCGLAQMPLAPGALGTNVLTAISTWSACGSPDN
jgi:hypothetical protein